MLFRSRITAAIFLLTNHLPPQENLKEQARAAALSLLPQIVTLREEMRSQAARGMLDVNASLRRLVSLIRMMVFAGSLSVHNAEVTIAAIDELSTFLSASARSHLSDNVRLTKEDFVDIVRSDSKGHIRDIKDSASSIGQNAVSTQVSLSTRRSGILGILKTSGELSIRDIAAHLPEYGEKTIQRELTSLIQGGIVKRSGEKRWSRYSLV